MAKTLKDVSILVRTTNGGTSYIVDDVRPFIGTTDIPAITHQVSHTASIVGANDTNLKTLLTAICDAIKTENSIT